jgi:hypothetical protein
MKSVIFVIVLVALMLIGLINISARRCAEAEGTLATFEQCFIDRGPFWYYGQRTPVFYATFEDGRKAYLASTLFGVKIEFVNE